MKFSMPPPTPGARMSVAFADLYEDMQVILDDCIFQTQTCLWKEMPGVLEAVAIPLSCLPIAELDEDDRGSAYAQAIVLEESPPIIIADGQWLDGRHRVHQARRLGQTHIWSFDFSNIQCHKVGGLGLLLSDPYGETMSDPRPGTQERKKKHGL
jgi:hypothetical protein